VDQAFLLHANDQPPLSFVDVCIDSLQEDDNIYLDIWVMLREFSPHCSRFVSNDTKYAVFVDLHLLADFQNLAYNLITSATMFMDSSPGYKSLIFVGFFFPLAISSTFLPFGSGFLGWM
jgi:hypothetical protein